MKELKELMKHWRKGMSAGEVLAIHCDTTAGRNENDDDDAAYAAWQTAVRDAAAEIVTTIDKIKAAVAATK